jgi:hypothetical protein
MAGSTSEGSDTTQAPTKLLGRRALLIGAAATGAGVVTAFAAGREPAEAANGAPVMLGAANAASATTSVATTSGNGLQAQNVGKWFRRGLRQ